MLITDTILPKRRFYLYVKADSMSLAHLEEHAVMHHGEVGVKQPAPNNSIAAAQRWSLKTAGQMDSVWMKRVPMSGSFVPVGFLFDLSHNSQRISMA